jgi:multidrug efflux pump
LATGAGAESRQQIGWVIVGGLTAGTLLTLFIIPAVYTLIDRRHALPLRAAAADDVSKPQAQQPAAAA